jgi:hypothetical protein
MHGRQYRGLQKAIYEVAGMEDAFGIATVVSVSSKKTSEVVGFM